MSLPPLYFRLRENGAQVFRVVADDRRGRLDFEPLAFANTRNGEIRPQGGREPSAEERAEIEGWIAARQAELARREGEVVDRTIEALNAAAHWVQAKASDTEIAEVGERLHLAMHDLRAALVRRQGGAARGD